MTIDLKLIINYIVNKILFIEYRSKIGIIGRSVKFGKGFCIRGNPQLISIGDNVNMEDTLINCGNGTSSVMIGNNVFFGHRVMLLARKHDYHLYNLKRQQKIIDGNINIGDGVWIGSGAIILSDVSIGKNSVIGAGSVVTKDVCSNCLVAGNPAKLIKKI